MIISGDASARGTGDVHGLVPERSRAGRKHRTCLSDQARATDRNNCIAHIELKYKLIDVVLFLLLPCMVKWIRKYMLQLLSVNKRV